MEKDEYLMIKEEILKSSEMVKKYRMNLYTFSAALLAFAFHKGDPFLFLLPFIVIIPLYSLSNHLIDSTMRMGAYLYVFIEPNINIKWETNLYQYDLLHRNQYSTKNTFISPYVLLSVCCILLSFFYLDFSNIQNFNFWICIFFQIVLIVICIYLFLFKHIDYIETKEKYINEWKVVKQIQAPNSRTTIETTII